MFKNEIIKLITNKAFYLSVFIILALNILFQYYQSDIRNTINIYPREYQKMCRELEYISDEEKISFLNSEIENMIYSGHMIDKLDLYRQMLLEINQCSEYNYKIRKVIENSRKQLADTQISSSEMARLSAIDNKYSALQSVELKFSNSYGIMQLINNRMQDILLIVLIVMICIILVCYEQESGISKLSQITLNGSYKLFLVKFAVLVVTIAALCCIITFENIIWAASQWGLGDLKAPIQRIYGMEMCALKINVIGFLFLFCGYKILFYCTVSSIVFLVCKFFKYTVVSIPFASFIFVVFGVLYNKFDYDSAVKIFNPINMGNFKYATEKYRSYFIIEKDVDILILFVLIQLLIIIAMLLITLAIPDVFGQNMWQKRCRNINEMHLGTNLFLHEMYKSIISSGVFLVCIMMAIAGFASYVKPEYNRCDSQTAFYKMYCEQLEGLERDAAYRNVSEQKAYILGKMDEPINDAETINTLNIALEALDIISTRLSKMNSNEIIFWDEGYIKMAGIDKDYSKYMHMRMIIASMFIVMCFVGIMSIDTETGMNAVISCTRHGSYRYYAIKTICGLIVIILAICMYMGLDIISLINRYGSEFINTRVASLALSDSSLNSSILVSIIGRFIVFFISTFLFMFLCYYICRKQKSRSLGICICEALFLLPQLCTYYIFY